MPSILIIDDEPDVLEATKFAFELQGYEVATADSGEKALQILKASPPQVLLVDYKLPGMSGAKFLEAARAVNPNIPAVMITGLTTEVEELEAECRRLGVAAFLHKPLQMEEVFRVIKEALQGSHG